MGKKLLDFDPINAQAGDFVYGGRSGRSPEEEMKIPVENITNAGSSLTAGRLAFKELVFSTISVLGWYTIAETEDITSEAYSAIIKIASGGGIVELNISYRGSTTVKNHLSTTIKKISQATFNADGTLVGMTNFRLVKSNSINGTGIKIQCYGDSGLAFQTSIYNNINRFSTGKGIFLVTPYLDNTPTLPDGVTVGTFLEAGEELGFDLTGASNNFIFPFMIQKQDDDFADITINWQQIPKQGTGLTITLPSSGLFFVESDGTTHQVTGAHTVSNLIIKGQFITFRVTETGLFTGITIDTPLFWLSKGINGKLTIT